MTWLTEISWLSPVVHYTFFVLAILTFEAAFLCWWRYFAIQETVVDEQGRPDMGVKTSSLLLVFAMLFTIEGCTNVFAPADHILWRPWRLVDWLVFISTITEIVVAVIAVRLMTVIDCGERIWALMLGSSMGCAFLLLFRFDYWDWMDQVPW
jgi:hypothetical protein